MSVPVIKNVMSGGSLLESNKNLSKNNEIEWVTLDSDDKSISAQLNAGNSHREERDRLVEQFMYLCKGYALKYIRKYSFSKNVSLELDDLTQEAILGLLHAAEIYDPEKGCSFSSYAVYWIEHQIRRYIEDKSELIRKPASMHAKIRQVHKLSKTMSDEDITAASGIDASEVRFIRILDNTELVSLNSEIVINGNRSCEIEEAVGDGTDLVEDIEQKEILDGARNYVTNMKDTESRNIMMWYLGYVDDKKTYSYADVAEITGQTKYRIRKTVEDTFRTLRLNFG